MNWDAVGAIAEALGAAGVIATLAYLSVQLRHTTRALKVTSNQQAAQASRVFLDTLARDGTGKIYSIGLRTYPRMTTEEKRTFVYAFNGLANSTQEAFAFHEGGVIDGELYMAQISAFACHVSTPGGAELWSELRDYYPSRFVAVVDEIFAAGDLPDILASPYFPIDAHPSPAAQQSAAADSA